MMSCESLKSVTDHFVNANEVRWIKWESNRCFFKETSFFEIWGMFQCLFSDFFSMFILSRQSWSRSPKSFWFITVFNFPLSPWVFFIYFLEDEQGLLKPENKPCLIGHRALWAKTEVLAWWILLMIECCVNWSTSRFLLEKACDDRLTPWKHDVFPFHHWDKSAWVSSVSAILQKVFIH